MQKISGTEPFDNIINFGTERRCFGIYVFCDLFFKQKFPCNIFETFILCYEILLILNDTNILWK